MTRMYSILGKCLQCIYVTFILVTYLVPAHSLSLRSQTSNHKYKAIRFSGGGIYFWWQAGVSQYLVEKFNEKDKVFPLLLGSSAGSLTATLLGNKCDMVKAAEYAIMQSEREKIFDSPKGLAGIWGPIVKEWLQVLLPEDIPPPFSIPSIWEPHRVTYSDQASRQKSSAIFKTNKT